MEVKPMDRSQWPPVKERRKVIHEYIMKTGGKTASEADAMIAQHMPHLNEVSKPQGEQ